MTVLAERTCADAPRSPAANSAAGKASHVVGRRLTPDAPARAPRPSALHALGHRREASARVCDAFTAWHTVPAL